MSLQIEWSKLDPFAKQNSTPAMSNLQPFSDVNVLKQDEITVTDFATIGELNQTILDGSQPIFPTDTSKYQWGIWSDKVCDENGYFSNKPTLEITFSQPVGSSGVTLEFWTVTNDYASEFNIKWYGEDNILISSKDFICDNSKYFAKNNINDYTKIVIAFSQMNKPFRFLKLTKIVYGEVTELSHKNLQNANILEELSPISDQVTINTLNCTAFSLDEDFDFITNAGEFENIKEKQRLNVMDDNKHYGTFFIKNVVSDGSKTLDITATDFLGIIENIEFKGGLYNNVTFGTILDSIIEQSETEKFFNYKHSGFDVDKSILNMPISGYVSIVNCRQALHMLVYAASSVLDCSRGEKIKIYPQKNVKSGVIGDDKLLINSKKPELLPSYTGVSLNAFTYSEFHGVKDIFQQDYEVGTHTVTFNEPWTWIALEGAELIKSDYNYVTFTVNTHCTVKATGRPYDVIKTPFIKENVLAKSKSIKIMTDVTLISHNNAQNVLDGLFSYYTKKYKVNFESLELKETIGDIVEVGGVTGTIERLEVDILKDNLTKVVLVGE